MRASPEGRDCSTRPNGSARSRKTPAIPDSVLRLRARGPFGKLRGASRSAQDERADATSLLEHEGRDAVVFGAAWTRLRRSDDGRHLGEARRRRGWRRLSRAGRCQRRRAPRVDLTMPRSSFVSQTAIAFRRPSATRSRPSRAQRPARFVSGCQHCLARWCCGSSLGATRIPKLARTQLRSLPTSSRGRSTHIAGAA